MACTLVLDDQIVTVRLLTDDDAVRTVLSTSEHEIVGDAPVRHAGHLRELRYMSARGMYTASATRGRLCLIARAANVAVAWCLEGVAWGMYLHAELMRPSRMSPLPLRDRFARSGTRSTQSKRLNLFPPPGSLPLPHAHTLFWLAGSGAGEAGRPDTFPRARGAGPQDRQEVPGAR